MPFAPARATTARRPGSRARSAIPRRADAHPLPPPKPRLERATSYATSRGSSLPDGRFPGIIVTVVLKSDDLSRQVGPAELSSQDVDPRISAVPAGGGRHPLSSSRHPTGA